MKNLNRLVFLLSLSFIGLTTLDQSSHVLEDHGLSENIEHVACVLENPEPRTFEVAVNNYICLLYTSPSPRDKRQSRMPSSA